MTYAWYIGVLSECLLVSVGFSVDLSVIAMISCRYSQFVSCAYLNYTCADVLITV